VSLAFYNMVIINTVNLWFKFFFLHDFVVCKQCFKNEILFKSFFFFILYIRIVVSLWPYKERYIIFAFWAVNTYTCYGVFFQSLSGGTNATLNCKTGLFFNVFLIKLLDLDQKKKGPLLNML